MRDEMLALLSPQTRGIYVDATFGGGGYSRAILNAAMCEVWAIDRDPTAIERGKELQKQMDAHKHSSRLQLIEGPFGDMQTNLNAHNITSVTGIVMDLGLSSFQLDEADRGFSFRFEGPLDMRMSKNGMTAAELINSFSEEMLADIIYHLGEERYARRIARAIVKYRTETGTFTTTTQFADFVRSTIPPDRSGLDRATRTFQAIRIYINDELRQIESALEQALGLLAPKGRLVVVSFHSLEDRIVKHCFNRAAGRQPSPSRYDPRSIGARQHPSAYTLLTTKAMRPTREECALNPRARSARLRALERVSSSLTYPEASAS